MKQKQDIFTVLGGRVRMYSGDYNVTSDAIWLAASVNNTGGGKKTVLDVGIGTGGVSLALLSRNSDLKITGIDSSAKMIAECAMNAELNGNKLELGQIDIIGWKTDKTFDIVVTNPPYFKGTGKFGQSDTHHNVDLYKWTAACLRRVRPRGYIYMIIDSGVVGEVISSLVDGRAGGLEITPLIGNAEYAERVLVSARQGVKTPTKLWMPQKMSDQRVLMDGLTLDQIRAMVTAIC